MATLVRYGPYVWFSEDGAPPGAVHAWSFGPWPWWGQVVSITAQPFSTAGADRHMEVTSISSHAAPDGARFIDCTVRNLGPDWTSYALWLGVVGP